MAVFLQKRKMEELQELLERERKERKRLAEEVKVMVRSELEEALGEY